MSDASTADHVTDDLAALLAGELDRDRALAMLAHLRGCEGCIGELLSVLFAASALQAARHAERYLGSEVARPDPSADPDTEGDTEAGAVEYGSFGAPAKATVPAATASGGEPVSDEGEKPLPPLARPQRVSRTRRALAGAAAAVVLVGGGVAIGTAVEPGPSAPSARVVARAVLRPLVAPRAARGNVAVEASGTSRTLLVHTIDLPTPSAGHFYEVWLLDPSTLKMLPMGVLGPAGTGEYAVSTPIMAGYSAVDISLQANDGNPAHSKTSVLRAFL